MKLITKLVLGLIGLIIVVGVAGAIMLTVFFDPNDYRNEIQQKVLENSGLELTINDDISWSLFPWLGLSLNSVDVKYPDKPQLASVKQARVAVKLLPLIGGKIEASSVLVDGLALTLKQDADGNNWTAPDDTETTVAAKSKPTTADNANETSTTADSSDKQPLSFHIESTAITNASVDYSDSTNGMHVILSKLNLTTGAITEQKPIPVQFNGQFTQLENNKPNLSGELRLTTTLYLDLAKQQYLLNQLKGQLDLNAVALGKKQISLNTRADVSIDLKQRLASLKSLSLSLGKMTAKGELNIARFDQPTVSGQLDIASFDVKKLLGELGMKPPATQNDSALRDVELHTTLVGPAGTLRFDPLTLKLDKTNLSGSAAYRLADGRFDVNLKGDAINVDHYLSPSDDNTTASRDSAATSDKKTENSSTVPDLSALRNINGQLALSMDSLQASSATFSNVVVNAKANNGLITVSRADLGMFGGTLKSTALLDARGKVAKIQTKGTLSKVQIGDLLTTFADSAFVTGTFDDSFNISTQGLDADTITRNLNGTSHFTITDGVIKGINVASSVCQGLSDFSSLASSSNDSDNSTSFTKMDGRLNITNGVIANNDLTASLDQMNLTGKGEINLPKQSLDYGLGLTLEDDLFDGRCSVNNRLQGVEIPLRCSGSFSDAPAKLCNFDKSAIEKLVRNKVKAKVQEKLGDKLKEKLGGEGGSSLLKGLLNR